MCPFIRKVLAEAQPFSVNPYSYEKFMSKGNIIGNIFVGNYAFVNRFLHGEFNGIFAFLLLDKGK